MGLFSGKLKSPAIYKGKDGSMGYRTNEIYTLTVWIDGGFIWVKSPGFSGCPYSPRAFQKIWEFV